MVPEEDPPPTPAPPSVAGGDDGREHDAIHLTWPEAADVVYQLAVSGPAGERMIENARPGPVGGLAPATTFVFRLRAVGPESASDWSSPLETCTRPAVPLVTFQVRPTGSAGSIAWSCEGPGELRLDIELTAEGLVPTIWEDVAVASAAMLSTASRAWAVRARGVMRHPLAPGGRNVSRWTQPQHHVIDTMAVVSVPTLGPTVAPSFDAVARVLRGRHGA
ncbi:MAG TPA: hypothetical protein VM925_15780 [Labilithrix sp.]|jgi:hypothetical protein|nr:hypothetical protein [Labilithrix sp.]